MNEGEPTGLALPRPWNAYREEAEYAVQDAIRRAVQDAVGDTILTPWRYADPMSLLDQWFATDRDDSRRDLIEEPRRRGGAIA